MMKIEKLVNFIGEFTNRNMQPLTFTVDNTAIIQIGVASFCLIARNAWATAKWYTAANITFQSMLFH